MEFCKVMVAGVMKREKLMARKLDGNFIICGCGSAIETHSLTLLWKKLDWGKNDLWCIKLIRSTLVGAVQRKFDWGVLQGGLVKARHCNCWHEGWVCQHLKKRREKSDKQTN